MTPGAADVAQWRLRRDTDCVEARTAALAADHSVEPSGIDERLAGYGVMGVPFSSGHVLALRHFPVSTVGPAYDSVWIRDPTGSWTMASTAPPQQSCARYFGAAVETQTEADIAIDWTGGNAVRVRVAEPVDLDWTLTLKSTPLTTLMSAACSAVPDRLWRGQRFSRAMARVATVGLRTGRMQLTGRTPNRHAFVARPRRLWLVGESSAQLHGVDLGRPAPLPEQASLADFWLPQRGLFMIGWAAFSGR